MSWLSQLMSVSLRNSWVTEASAPLSWSLWGGSNCCRDTNRQSVSHSHYPGVNYHPGNWQYNFSHSFFSDTVNTLISLQDSLTRHIFPVSSSSVSLCRALTLLTISITTLQVKPYKHTHVISRIYTHLNLNQTRAVIMSQPQLWLTADRRHSPRCFWSWRTPGPWL